MITIRKQYQKNSLQILAQLSFLKHWYCHLAILFSLGGIYYFLDRPIAAFFSQQTFLRPPLEFIAFFKSEVFVVLFVSFAMYYRVRKNSILMIRYGLMTAGLLVSYLVCGIFKYTLGRARPELFVCCDIFGFFGPNKLDNYHSFPSGHTTAWMTITYSLSLFFPKYLWQLIAGGLLLSLTRVLLIRHYLTDVLAAAYITLLLFWVFWTWMSRDIKGKNANENIGSH